MATNFKPPAGHISMVRGFSDAKKINVSTHPRKFAPGSLLWINKVSGRYQAEPANIAVTAAATDMTSATSNDGNSSSLAATRGAFAALFLGVAAEGRIPQQMNSFGQFGAGGTTTAALMDASKPFITFYDEGIAKMPVGPTLSSTGVLTSAVELGTWVEADGFENNDGAIGFYDDAGATHATESKWYLYDNCVNVTTTIGNRIGVVVERAEIGSPVLLVRFISQALILGPLA